MPTPAYDTVLLLTVDTLNERFLGRNQPEWNTTPNLDAFFADSVVLENTYTVKGSTVVALPSLLTGQYPRNHKIRSYSPETGPPASTMVQERFQEAGFTTLGWSNNYCRPFMDRGIDEEVCVANDEEIGGQSERDRYLTDSFLSRLQTLPDEESAFFWVHLFDPHFDYVAQEPWFSEFHPEDPPANLDLASAGALSSIMFGIREFGDAEQRYLDAVYASQVRATDEMIGEILAGLDASGRRDRTLVVFGADHGEELGLHNNFLWHACSPYNPVLNLTYAVRAPELLQPGLVSDAVSITDIAPTLVDLAGLDWSGEKDGISLQERMSGGDPLDHPVYFERGSQAAGIVYEDHKYFSNPNGDYIACLPYINQEGTSFSNDLEELYDLKSDPDEMSNLASSRPDTAQALKEKLCAWITEDVWASANGDASNPLVTGCYER